MGGGPFRRRSLFVRVCMPFGPARANDFDDPRIMLFSDRDIWRNGAFAHGGFIIAPSGLDQDGLLLKIMLVVGAEWLTQVLPGWRIKRGNVELKVFMGPEIQNHHLRSDDPANRLRRYSYGLRVAAEVWCEQTAEAIIAAKVSLSSIATSNSARAAYGWRVLEERCLVEFISDRRPNISAPPATGTPVSACISSA